MPWKPVFMPKTRITTSRRPPERLTTLKFPTDVRVDSGVVKGQEISPYYDPMIAKIIAHAASRGEAIAQLRDAVSRTRITGIDTNSPYLSAILNHPTFCDAVHSTGFVEQFSGELTSHSRDDRHRPCRLDRFAVATERRRLVKFDGLDWVLGLTRTRSPDIGSKSTAFPPLVTVTGTQI